MENNKGLNTEDPKKKKGTSNVSTHTHTHSCMPAYCILGPLQIQDPLGKHQLEHQYYGNSQVVDMQEIWSPGSLLRGG